mgnify:CR=1 FL=1
MRVEPPGNRIFRLRTQLTTGLSTEDATEPRRPVVRHFVKCTAWEEVVGERARACAFETKRYPKTRSAEIEYQGHALAAHGQPGQVKIVVSRREEIIDE